MEKKIEYTIATVTNTKVFPEVFMSKEEAELFRKERSIPSHWKIVKREVFYGEWDEVNI